MLAWLYDILIGNLCKHRYKIIQHGPLRVDGTQYGTYFIQQCEHCGKIITTKSK